MSGLEADAAPAIADMDEDRAANLLLASHLAPLLCRGCERYHLRYVARRSVEDQDGLDKHVTVRLLAPLIAERARGASDTIELVIAGAADNGTLATAAAAAVAADALSHCRFTVLDLCPTPLMLCEAYARAKNIAVNTRTEDLLDDDLAHPADFVVVHSLFRHIPTDRQVGLLQRFASWLKPGGRVLFSTMLDPPTGPRPNAVAAIALLRSRLEAGALKIAEPVEAFMARLGEERRARAHEDSLPDARSVRALAERAGLTVHAFDETEGEWGRPGIEGKRRRVFAVLGR